MTVTYAMTMTLLVTGSTTFYLVVTAPIDVLRRRYWRR